MAGIREIRNDGPDRMAEFSNRFKNCANNASCEPGAAKVEDMQSFPGRMVGAARFDAGTYEEIEADTTASGQAVAVVIIASLAAAVGVGATDFRSLLGMIGVAIISWLIWVLLTLFIGTRLLPGSATKADFGEVLRTTGFSASVGILRILGIFSAIRGPVFTIVTIWMLVTFVIAIRQALDYTSTGRAIAVCLLGWLIHGILFFGFVRSVI